MSAKLIKYSGFLERLFFVVANNSFSQKDLDLYMNKKIRVLPKNAKIITIESLEQVLSDMKTYPNPLLK